MDVNVNELQDNPPGTGPLHVRSNDGLHEDHFVLHPTPTNDPNDPLNWKTWEKMTNFTLVLLYSLLIYSLLGVSTPTWDPMHLELGFSYKTLTNSYAVGSAALCFGAIIFMPFAIKFGRRPAYLLSTLLQVMVSIWASRIQNVADLMLINAFNCFLGSLAEAIVQMTIADIFFLHTRGVMTSIYVWVVVVANSLAPVAAGYVTVSQGWRWVWKWIAILLGVMLVMFFFFYEETKFTARIEGAVPGGTSATDNIEVRPSTELEREKKNIQPVPVMPQISCVESAHFSIPPRRSYLQKLKLWTTSPGSFTSLIYDAIRPFTMVITIPGVTYTALVYGMVTACYQVSVTIIAAYMVYPPYNFNSAQIGLMSGIPGFVGTTLGGAISGLFSDRIVIYLAKRNGGIYEPEMRLWLLLAFSIPMPVGLLVFGYGLQQGQPWPILAVGSGIFTFGMTPVSSMVLAYATDAYIKVIADAMVGVVFIRNAFATVLVVSLTPWVNAVGVANVFLTLAMVAVLLGVMGVLLLIYGKRLRVMTAPRYEAWSARKCE